MKEKTIRIGNRISGLAMIAFGGLVASSGVLFLIAGSSLFIAEGAGDLVTGDHHYVSSKLLKYFSNGKLDIKYMGDRYK